MIFGLIKNLFYSISYRVGVQLVRPLLIKNGGGLKVSPTATIKFPKNIIAGKNLFINHNCSIWASPDAQIFIGDDVLFGPGVVVLTSNHGVRLNALIREQLASQANVRIGSDCWIGANSVILPGVVLGDGCVIGAGSIVTKNMPAMTVCAGVPAKPLKKRV